MNQMSFGSSAVSVWNREIGYPFEIIQELKDSYSRYKHTSRYHNYIYLVFTRRGPAFLISDNKLDSQRTHLYRGPLLIPYTDIHSEGLYARNPRVPLIHAWVEVLPESSFLDFENREEEFDEINRRKINFTPFMQWLNNKVAFLTVGNKGEFKDGNIAFYDNRTFVRKDNRWMEAAKSYNLPGHWKAINKYHALIIVSGLSFDPEDTVEISDFTMMFTLNDPNLLKELKDLKKSESVEVPLANMRIIHKYGDRVWGEWRQQQQQRIDNFRNRNREQFPRNPNPNFRGNPFPPMNHNFRQGDYNARPPVNNPYSRQYY